jgi:hypothetical protein
MKMWYSATEVKLQQMDADLKARSAELDARAALTKREIELLQKAETTRLEHDSEVLELQTKNAQDAAQSVITNAKNVAELTEKLAVAQAQMSAKDEHIANLQSVLRQEREERTVLLATVTELAKKPVIVEKLTQTSTAVPAQMCVIQGDKAVPVQIVK